MDSKKQLRYWIAAILLVVGCVEFFLFSRPALGYMLCCLFFLAAYCCLWTKEVKPRLIDFVFMAVIVALALPYALFNNTTLRALNVVALFFCGSILFARRVTGEWVSWSRPVFIFEAGIAWVLRPFATLVAPWKETFAGRRRRTAAAPAGVASVAGTAGAAQTPGEASKTQPDSPESADSADSAESADADLRFSVTLEQAAQPNKRASVVLQIIVAVCIVVPVLSILISLLAKSDPIFASYMHDVLNWIRMLKISTAVWHLIIMIVLLPFMLSIIWTIRTRRLFVISKATSQSGGVPAERQRFIPGLIASIVLISINAVYLMYAVVQFVYLFSGVKGTLPGDLTYASYARRGFTELVVVAVINIIVILVATKFTRRQGASGVIVRVCNFALIALAGVQLVSAFTRLSLYTSAYGLSQMRVFVFVFLGLTAVLFLILLAREVHEKMPLFKAAVFATLAALIVLNYMVPDAFIARYNITHFVAGDLQTSKLDLNYLWSGLSVDSDLVVLQHADEISALGPKYSEQIANFKSDLGATPTDTSGTRRSWGYLDSEYAYGDRDGDIYFLPYKTLQQTSWRNYNYNLWRLKSIAEAR
ncbi:MAG: DUF4173 domain-containing protein [Coriobacteriia bacterium]|nr:DUF4173 domain-containing protein [Coriobacteriia bacterium]